MGCIPYMGYITRKEKDGENEARVYKVPSSWREAKVAVYGVLVKVAD
jgi:hypothetical protein